MKRFFQTLIWLGLLIAIAANFTLQSIEPTTDQPSLEVMTFEPSRSVSRLSEDNAARRFTRPSNLPTFSTPPLTTPQMRLPVARLRAPSQWHAPGLELDIHSGSLDRLTYPSNLDEAQTPSWKFSPRFDREDWNLPQPELSFALPTQLNSDLLSMPPSSGRLRPRSPYCMPGHTSQNFVVYSLQDGLPLHPGAW